MIITISGAPGSGKSVVAKIVAKKLGYRHYSNGDFMRKMAEKRGISFEEFTETAKIDPSIDKEIDAQSKKLVEKGEDDFIIDARLGFHFIPSSVKIYLAVAETEAAKRIFNAKREEEMFSTEENTLDFIRKRLASEKQRYMNSYGIDCHDLTAGHYDYLIDTTNLTIAQVVDVILKTIEDENRSI